MANGNQRYNLDSAWGIQVSDLGLSVQDVLRQARLPLDLLNRESPTLSSDEYFRLWEGIEQLLPDPAFPIRIAEQFTTEAFSPPLFACLCSADMNSAMKRLSQYKPLVGPLRLDVDQKAHQTTIAFSGLPENRPAPQSLLIFELAFMVSIARTATRQHIVPKAVAMKSLPTAIDHYERYFGTAIDLGEVNQVTFTATDAQRPFLTANEQMWAVFEPDLRRRMQELKRDAQFKDRVRACLIEMLASGETSMNDVAQRLAVSPRTLQRQLKSEGTTFQRELTGLRADLARHYLANFSYSGAEISYLLGYQDPNSFFRAFHSWTGQTPEVARTALQTQ